MERKINKYTNNYPIKFNNDILQKFDNNKKYYPKEKLKKSYFRNIIKGAFMDKLSMEYKKKLKSLMTK